MANRRIHVLVIAPILVIACCIGFLIWKGDGLNWVRRRATKEIVHSVHGSNGRLTEHSFYFEKGIPDELQQEIREHNVQTFVSHRSIQIEVNEHANLIDVRREQEGESWLAEKWRMLRRALGL